MSIDKAKLVLEAGHGLIFHCEFASGKLPKVGNKGVAVLDETSKKIRFKGPRGAAHLRVVGSERRPR